MTLKVEATIKAPVDCTPEQFREWVFFELNYTGSISLDNPLHGYNLEASEIKIKP